MKNLNGVRRRYARKVRRIAHLRSKLLIHAFAETPRERYLGPPPWKLLTLKGDRVPHKSHPRDLYDDVLVGILPERFLNNGQPSGLAMWFEALDLKRNERVVRWRWALKVKEKCGGGYLSRMRLPPPARRRGEVPTVARGLSNSIERSKRHARRPL